MVFHFALNPNIGAKSKDTQKRDFEYLSQNEKKKKSEIKAPYLVKGIAHRRTYILQ